MRIGIGLGIGFQGGGANVSVFPLGDSLTLGHSGTAGANNAGGYRSKITTPVLFKGPYTSFGNHAGVNGDTVGDMDTRFATDWSGNEADEVWVLALANDVLAGALTTAQMQTAYEALLDTIYTEAAGKIVRVFTNPFLDYTSGAKNAVLDEMDRRLAQPVAADRAAGQKVYVLDVGDPLQDTSHLDGVDAGGLEHPINGTYGIPGVGTGYSLMANRLDRYLVAQAATTPQSSFGGLTLEAWYRADTISGTELTDKSGAGRHVTLVNAPTAGTGINGQAKLTFNGTTQYGRSGSGWTIAQPNTIVHVCRPTSVTGGPALFDAATLTARCAMLCSAANVWQLFAGSTFSETLVGPTTIPHAYFGNYNGASSKIWLESGPRRQTVSPGTQGLNGITIAASAAASPSNFMAGDWYETIIFSGTPTDEEVVFALTGGYLNPRYGFWPLLGQTTSW